MGHLPGRAEERSAMKRHTCILVTGGAGFVGSNLALRMRRRDPDARVIAADNLKRRGSEFNLPRLLAAGVEFVHADVRNPEDLAFPGIAFDLVLECSAEPSVLAGFDAGPAYLVNTNLTGTVNCLEVARRSSADVVFFSTSRVYPIAALESLTTGEVADALYARRGTAVARAPARRGSRKRFRSRARVRYTARRSCAPN